MEKIMIDERTGWEYELIGEQYYPTGRVMRDGRLQPGTVAADNEPEEDNGPKKEIILGVWGQRCRRYLRQHRKALYTELLTSGKLDSYLADLNEQAEAMFLELVKQFAARESVTEQLKAQDQMLWVQRMNSIRNRATEIVNHEMIYA